jgi:hypothetical protein
MQHDHFGQADGSDVLPVACFPLMKLHTDLLKLITLLHLDRCMQLFCRAVCRRLRDLIPALTFTNEDRSLCTLAAAEPSYSRLANGLLSRVHQRMTRRSAGYVAHAAACCGSVEVLNMLQQLRPAGWQPNHRELSLLLPACAKGHISVVQWAIEAGCDVSSQQLLKSALQSPAGLPLVELLLRNGATWSIGVGRAAAEAGALSLLKWARANYDIDLDEGTMAAAARGGHRLVLEWLLEPEQECPPWDEGACAGAAASGDLSLLQWLRERGAPWDSGTCEFSTASSVALSSSLYYVSLLVFSALGSGCVLSALAGTEAAEEGHMHILYWAYENGCEGDEQTCSGAAGRGDLPMLQFLHQRGCHWDTLTCSAAASHLSVLQWARANGCPWDDQVTRQAARDGNLETLRWARSQGAPWHVKVLAAAPSSDTELLQWMRENGAPDT